MDVNNEKIKKLPKWAQEYITSLKVENEDLKEDLECFRLDAQGKDSVFFIKSETGEDIPLPGFRRIQAITKQGTFSFQHASEYNEMRIFSEKRLAILPRANNLVCIKEYD